VTRLPAEPLRLDRLIRSGAVHSMTGAARRGGHLRMVKCRRADGGRDPARYPGPAHYDQPPPDERPDVAALLAADAIRLANQLHVWIEVEDGQITGHGMSGGERLGSTTLRLRTRGVTFAGVALPDRAPPPEVHGDRVRFTQTAGGHTGAPLPRAVPRSPFWRLTAPVAWSTIALTLGADGSSQAEIAGASPFPRHYLYDSIGRLARNTAVIRPPARPASGHAAERPADRPLRGPPAPRRAAALRDQPAACGRSGPGSSRRPGDAYPLQHTACPYSGQDPVPSGRAAPRPARQPGPAWRCRRADISSECPQHTPRNAD